MASIKSQGCACILACTGGGAVASKGLLLIHVFGNRKATNIACWLLGVSRTIKIWRYALSMLCSYGIKNDTIYFSENVLGQWWDFRNLIFFAGHEL